MQRKIHTQRQLEMDKYIRKDIERVGIHIHWKVTNMHANKGVYTEADRDG